MHRRTRAFALIAAAAVVAACGRDDAHTDDTAAATDAAGDEAHLTAQVDTAGEVTLFAMTLPFEPIDESGVTGTVELQNGDAGVVVTVALRSTGAGVHQGHIHGGRCSDRSRSVAPLEPVVTDATGAGEATSTVSMPASELLNGQHIVVYHAAGGSPGASVACAEIPQAS